MDILYIAIFLGLLAFFAHIIKGLTGFGPAIVFVSIGSFVYNPVDIIVLAALLDIIGGLYLITLNPSFCNHKQYWVPIGSLMILGAIIGSAALYLIPSLYFEYLLGISIILIAIWFLTTDVDPNGKDNHTVGVVDGLVGAFSGFCGGFTGMGGPPLIIYLGSILRKELFRAVIVPIFLMAAIARFTSYGALGMINTELIVLYIFPPIGTLVGNHVGNEFFEDVNQQWFTVLIGVILLLSGIRLLT